MFFLEFRAVVVIVALGAEKTLRMMANGDSVML
jgi:hypothetical protein